MDPFRITVPLPQTAFLYQGKFVSVGLPDLFGKRHPEVFLSTLQAHYKEPVRSDSFRAGHGSAGGRAAVRTALSWKRKMLGWWRDWVYSNMAPSLL